MRARQSGEHEGVGEGGGGGGREMTMMLNRSYKTILATCTNTHGSEFV